MKGIAKLMQNQVGRVHHVVQGLDADGAQTLLRPIWAGTHLHVVQLHSQVVGAVLGGVHRHRHRRLLLQCGIQVNAIGQNKLFCRHGPDAFHGAVQQPGPEVPGHPPMAHGVVPVGCQADFNDIIPFETHNLRHVCTYRSVWGQHHDAVVAAAKSQFIFCANHAKRNFAADLALLDFEGFPARGVQGGADGCHRHLLAFRDVGSTADNAQRTILESDIHRTNAQAVGVGVLHHFGDVADDHTAEPPKHVFNVVHAFHFQPGGGQDLGCLLDVHFMWEQLSEPAGRNFHGMRLIPALWPFANLLCRALFSVG